MKLDDLDFKILDLMNENPRLSYRKIAEAVGSTTPTVKERIEKLERNGIIRGYFTMIDYSRLWVYKDVYIIYGANKRILNKLKEYDGVRRIFRLEENAALVIFLYDENRKNMDFMNFLEENGAEYERFSVLDEPHLRNEILINFNKNITYCDYCGKEIKERPVLLRINGEEKHFCCNTCRDQYILRLERLKMELEGRD